MATSWRSGQQGLALIWWGALIYVVAALLGPLVGGAAILGGVGPPAILAVQLVLYGGLMTAMLGVARLGRLSPITGARGPMQMSAGALAATTGLCCAQHVFGTEPESVLGRVVEISSTVLLLAGLLLLAEGLRRLAAFLDRTDALRRARALRRLTPVLVVLVVADTALPLPGPAFLRDLLALADGIAILLALLIASLFLQVVRQLRVAMAEA